MLCRHGLHHLLSLKHSATAIRWTDPYNYSDTNDALRPSQQLWSNRDGQIFSRASLTKR